MSMYQISPTKWTNKSPQKPQAQSSLPCPYVISDEMPLTEQVDGKFYSSKSKFRAVGKALGLLEIGNEKFPPRQRASARREQKEKRRRSLKLALDKYKGGYRAQQK